MLFFSIYAPNCLYIKKNLFTIFCLSRIEHVYKKLLKLCQKILNNNKVTIAKKNN